ncbi:MAG: aminomethyltransferase family protein [Lysobacterales bacterium]|jgi:aminomethyltransferase
MNDVLNPRQIENDPYAGERLLRTPFYPRAVKWNVRDAWGAWNGYLFAEYFYDPEYEYFCIRNGCGVYDISPMQKYRITGADAQAMLDRMVTRDLSKLRDNRVTYVVWCTDEGRLVDDGTIFRLGPEEFMLTCGSPCTAWLRMAAYGFEEVHVEDISDRMAALAFQGPTTCAVLKRMGLDGIEQARRFDIRHFSFHGDRLMVSRTGFTGDLGYELWIKPELALALWDELFAAGEDFSIQPFGEEATNMARLEAGLIMPGMDFNEALKTVNFRHDQSPLELSLEWLIDWDKPHFNGRRALLREREQGPAWRLLKLDIPGNKVAEGAILYDSKACRREIGYVTSAMWSPAVKANIAMAMVRGEHEQRDIWVEIYYTRELRQYRKVVLATVKERPFWTPERVGRTPPSDH